MSRLHSRLIGLIATLGLVAFVAGIPVVLLDIGAAPSPSNFGWSRLSAPDDGTLALAVIGVGAWIAWAVFTFSVALSVASRLRGHRTSHLPGLQIPQLAADRIVAAAALLFVTVPALGTVLPAPAAHAEASTGAPLLLTRSTAAVETSPVKTTPPATPASTPAASEKTEPYTVKRGDSLWKIAKEHLGDGTRFVELAELNRDVLGNQPGFLIPGTRLLLPAEAHESDGAYVVEAGDTLSDIAGRELGDAHAYPEIFEASRATTQPDGQHLTDPDLIRPGWHLTIPDVNPAPENAPQHRAHTPSRVPEQLPSAETGSSSSPQAPTDDTQVATTDSGSDLPSWVLPGLAGGGAALAGALLLILRQHRRTQLRYRSPGRIVAPPPPELRPAEKSAQAAGSITAPQVEHLDRALRSLGEPTTSCPRLLQATLTPSEIKLALAAPTDLPRPWTGHGIDWTLSVGDVPPEQPGTVAPYPLLASVGMAPRGQLIFLNLEELGSVVLTGDAERAKALGRHIAAELSVNPWSQLVEIDTLGIGRELADIDPLRLQLHADGDTAFLDRLAADVEASDADAAAPDRYRALVATAGAHHQEAVRKVAKSVTSHAGRTGAAVITVDGEPDATDAVLELTADGTLKAAALDQDLTAAGLTSEEALACATLVDLTRDTTEGKVPQPEDRSAPSDSAGALTASYVEARPKEGPAGNRSLLPEQTAAYTEYTASTADDVDVLAPLATAPASSAVRNIDPRLDEDLARWESPVLVAPKLTLLGPVTARTTGDTKQVAKRRPFYVELLTYLTLHPNGVTASEVADAFGITKERARSDLSIVRHWLGTDPRTGEPHLPDARTQRDRADRGAVYATHGVLCDLDLFRRLRSRGQADGEKGLDDLITALRLVTGEPFSEQRESGWGWLLDGERTDHIITCAIVDVAHIVTTRALSTNQLDLARFSAETAYRAAPYDETSRLDLIDVAAATGHAATAHKQLIDDVLNRSDDGLGPIDIPDRTAEVIRQRGWSTTTSRREQRA